MFHRSVARRGNVLAQAIKPVVESLEARTLLTGATLDASGLLTIIGTDSADRIVVSVNKNNTSALRVEFNGQFSNFSKAQVKAFHVEGRGGNDRIIFDQTNGKITAPAWVSGGRGDDYIVGASGNDSLYGDRNNDTIIGGDGADLLDGGLGDDTLMGGGTIGRDTIIGNGGKDLINTGGRKTNLTMDSDDQLNVGAAAVMRPFYQAGTIDPVNVVGLTPRQIRTAYGFTGNKMVSGLDGVNQTVVVVTAFDTPNIQADMGKFDQQFTTPTYNLKNTGSLQVMFASGNQPAPDPTANHLWTVDATAACQWIHALAPKANIILMEADSDNAVDLYAAVDAAVQQIKAKGGVISIAWGSPFPDVPAPPAPRVDESALFKQFDKSLNSADTKNISFVVAAGDRAAYIGHPSGTPFVTAVGGTTLTVDANGGYTGEVADPNTGGNTSAIYPQPVYQKGLTVGGVLVGDARATPDVAFDSDPASGLAVFSSDIGGWMQTGGTSMGAPAWAAVATLANQLRTQSGQTMLGNQFNDQLYALSRVAYTTTFNDITTDAGGTPAGTGYDLATGLGSPKVDGLVPALAGYVTSSLTFHSDYTTSLAAPLTVRGVTNFSGIGDFTVDQAAGVVTLAFGTLKDTGGSLTLTTANAMRLNPDMTIRGYGTADVTTDTGDTATLTVKFIGRAYRIHKQWAVDGAFFAIDPATGAMIAQGVNPMIRGGFSMA